MEYMELKKALRGRVQEKMDFVKDFTDAEVEDTIDEVILEQGMMVYPVEIRRRLGNPSRFAVYGSSVRLIKPRTSYGRQRYALRTSFCTAFHRSAYTDH